MNLKSIFLIVAAILMFVAWVNPKYATNQLTWTFNHMCGSFFFLILALLILGG